VFGYYGTVRAQVQAHQMPELTKVAEAAAVLGEQCSIDLLACLVDVDRQTLSGMLGYLQVMGLLEHGTVLRNPVRRALLGTAAFVDTVQLRLRAAELRYRDGAPVCQVALHLLMLGMAPQAWAIAALREAAENAVTCGEYTQAASLLRLAARW